MVRDIPLDIVIEDDLSLSVAQHTVLNTDNRFFIDRALPDYRADA